MKKRASYILILCAVFLVFSCQESPVQELHLPEDEMTAEQLDNPVSIQSNPLEPLDDCVPVFDGPDDPDNPDECIPLGGPGGGPGGNNPPNLIYFNGGEGPSYDLYYSISYQPFSNPAQISWTANNETPNLAATRKSPGAVQFNGYAYIFYPKRDLNEIWYTVSNIHPTIQWSNDRRLPVSSNTYTEDNVMPVVHNGKIYVFYVHANNEIRYITSSDGISWNEPIVIPGKNSGGTSITGFAQVLTNIYPIEYNNDLYVFYTEYDSTTTSTGLLGYTSNLRYISTSNEGVTWVGGNNNTVTHVSTFRETKRALGSPVVFGDKLYVIYSVGNQLLRVTSTTDLQNWSSISNRPFILNASTTGRSSPAVKNGNIIVLYRIPNSDYIYMAYSSDGTNWSGGNTVPGESTAFPFLLALDFN